MKIISLNIWGGKLFDGLISFVKEQSVDTDVFCFQEVLSTNSKTILSNGFRTNIFSELEKVLPGFEGVFSSALEGHDSKERVDFDISYGLAIFYKKNIKILDIGHYFVHLAHNQATEEGHAFPRNMQYLNFEYKNNKYTLMNFHGLYDRDNEKLDTPERLEQSKKIKKYTNESSKNSKVILLGDFNLLPNTKSIGIVEKDMKNLIKIHNITSTRNKHFRHFHKYPLYADYAIVSPDINVKDFKVLEDEISDHAPLQLIIE